MMKERPILFSAPMVRALLDGTKTQTRRVCKPAANLSAVVPAQDPKLLEQVPPYLTPGWFGDEEGDAQFFSPYGVPGDRLWVREAWAYFGGDEYLYQQDPACVWYRANDIGHPDRPSGRWRPSIFMPRWASRITLEVAGVRVERLQDISDADAIAEGLRRTRDECAWHVEDDRHRAVDPGDSYASLWESINGAGSWDANAWVWVVSFKRIV